MPYYCTVPRCTSMAGKAKNVSFHQFPRDEELAKLWNKILKRGKPYTKYSKVCSLHFTPEDYTITSVGKNKGQWRTLRKDAIPSQNLPSESPTPYQRKQWGSWTHNAPTNALDTTIQQQVAQAIYMQTMLAMQAAQAADVPPFNHSNGLPQPTAASTEAPFAHTSNTPDTDILKGKQTNTSEKSNSYKCTECSKCFKDPDVFILHKRSHIKNEKNEKENFNLNLTLQANPILANLLKTNTENTNIFDGNLISVESLLMTALAANMEGYMRNFTSMIKSDDRGNMGHDRGNMGHDRGNLSHDRGNLNNNGSNCLQSRLDLSSRSSCVQDRENATQRGGLSCDRSLENDMGDIDHDRSDITHDIGTGPNMGNRNSDSNLIRDRIIELYRNNDAYDSDRNIRYYENDEHNERGPYHNSDRVTSYEGRGMISHDRGVINDDRVAMSPDRGVMNDKGYNGDGISNDDDDDDSQGTEEPICDSDLNESIDSNKLVIDETA